MDIKKMKKKSLTADRIVTASTDPDFYAGLDVLPNPDPILRKIGKTSEVYNAIKADAHVMGERRSTRAGLLKYEYRIQPGGDSNADMRAFELCSDFMKRPPAPGFRWPDLLWNILESVYEGMKVHELTWEKKGDYILPSGIYACPQRRFTFSSDRELRLITRSNLQGVEIEPFLFLLTRHMHSEENPYGEALLSSCFWPYTFKHSGFRYFTKFCEKYGLPWALGKHQQGATDGDINKLVQSLAMMVEDAVAAFPEGTGIELLETKHSGDPVQEKLINICNKEMSKALTSQTLATETGKNGARAASETHRERETSVNEADRELVADSVSEIFEMITTINVAGANPPKLEFYEETEARADWVKVFDTAKEFIDIPVSFARSTLQFPKPEKGEEILRSSKKQEKKSTEFSSSDDNSNDNSQLTLLISEASKAADIEVSKMINSIKELLDDAENLEEVKERLLLAFPLVDDNDLEKVAQQAIESSFVVGMSQAQDGE